MKTVKVRLPGPGRKYFGEMVEYFKRNRGCLTLIVEKVDRLYRNNRDPITIEDLNIEVHLVKDNEIISKDSRSGCALHSRHPDRDGPQLLG
jgi:DNA invertase Pin-like site-specific DNA recombinase